MNAPLNVLMIDDHEAILEGYKTILSKTDFKIKFKFAKNCDVAIQEFYKAKNKIPFHIVFIDVQLPASSNGKYTSGEDLAVLAKELMPNAKIIFLTMHNEAHRLLNIIKNTPHNAILVKSEINAKTLTEAFTTVVLKGVYYSKTVQNVKAQVISYVEDIDENDRRILFHLNQGVNNKDLPKFIDLSLSAIEKRIRNLKHVFNVSTKSQLLKEAKKRGLL